MMWAVRGVGSALLLIGSLCASAPTYAQLPFFSSESEGPDVRIAGEDPLADELARFLASVDRTLSEAEAEASSLEAEATSTRARPDALRRTLLYLARQRVKHLAAARVTALRAQDILQAPLPRARPTDLPRLVSLRQTATRLEARREEEERVAERLEAASVEAAGPAGGPREIAERNAQVARARAARARVFEAHAQARRAAEIAARARRELVLEPSALAAATEAVDTLEAGLRQLEAEPPPDGAPPSPPAGTSSVALERYEQEALTLDAARAELRARRVRAAEAELLAGRALVWAHRTLEGADPLGRPGARPPQLSAEALEARRVSLDDERASRVTALARLRREIEGAGDAAWVPLLEAQAQALDDTLSTLLEEEQWVEQALATISVVEQVRRVRDRLPFWQTGLLLILTLLGGFVLLKYGGQFLTLVLAPGLGWLRLSEKESIRAQAIASLLWPLSVATATAAVIVWPVLRLELTVLEALDVIDRPLFYVEDTGVSPLSVVQFVLTIWAAVVISRWLRHFLTERLYARTSWDIGLTNALDTLVHYVVLLVGLVLGLRFVGVGFSSLAILAGVLGIGIGFGLRNITENFISGLIILAERPVKIGDFIEVNEGEVEGRVDSIRARSTTVITRDNISMIIPNSEFVAKPVVNWSHGDPKVRVAIPVGVVYGSDTDLVRRVLLEVAGRHGQVLRRPAPEVQFRAFGGSSLDFLLLVWIEEQMHRFRIASDLHFAVDKAFRRRGIEIAFPQLDLHLKSIQASVATALHDPPEPPPEEPGPKLPEGRARPRGRSTGTRPALGSGSTRPADSDKPDE